MAARILDGVAIAAELRAELAPRVAEHLAAGGKPPRLAVLLASDSEADRTFAAHKQRDGAEAGVDVEVVALPVSVSQQQLLAELERLNEDERVTGILVQTPLPDHIDARAAMNAVDPSKDIDGLTPLNLGLLLQGRAKFLPATAAAVIELIRRSGVDTAGARAVVLGRSPELALPLALLLAQKDGANATVTVCGEDFEYLEAITQQADILVVNLNRPRVIGAAHVRPGAVVIDAGLNVLPGATPGRRYRVAGDVDTEAVRGIARAIAPAPGGTGPVTIAMLLENTLAAAQGR